FPYHLSCGHYVIVTNTICFSSSNQRSILLNRSLFCNLSRSGYPPSQNMYQLNYSCTAEKYAMMVCNQQAPLNPVGKLSSDPIAAEFELWWGNHDFGAFINSTAVYSPNFDYTVFSQLVSGYAVSIGCTDTCYGQKQVYCAFDVWLVLI
ncbi:hypothetical protein V3C99_015338, partial [Haemonchus contortus]|uniref:SCP domain-containing protein n=1 Tax=Haemonchus contortus TaxID=6289 RepID=A0A7I4YXI2_HAECO